MTQRDPNLCTARWYDGRASGPCNRAAKENGLCAQHLAGRRRSEKARAEADEKAAAERALLAATQEKCARLAARGLSAQPDYSAIGYRYTGRVVVSPDALLRFLDEHDCTQTLIDRQQAEAEAEARTVWGTP